MIKKIFFIIFIFMSTSLLAQSITLHKKDILKASKDYILKHASFPKDKIILKLKTPLSDFEIEGEDLKIKVEGEEVITSLGRVPLKVEVFNKEKLFKIFYLTFYLDLKTKAFLTKRWIKRGESLSLNNLSLIETTASELPPNYIEDISFLKGKVTKVALPPGKILTLSHIESPPLIKKGQLIRLLFSTPYLKVETKGLALADGRKGAIIRAKNLDSGKIVYGKVKDSDTLIVNFDREEAQ